MVGALSVARKFATGFAEPRGFIDRWTCVHLVLRTGPEALMYLIWMLLDQLRRLVLMWETQKVCSIARKSSIQIRSAPAPNSKYLDTSSGIDPSEKSDGKHWSSAVIGSLRAQALSWCARLAPKFRLCLVRQYRASCEVYPKIIPTELARGEQEWNDVSCVQSNWWPSLERSVASRAALELIDLRNGRDSVLIRKLDVRDRFLLMLLRGKGT